MLVFGAVHSAWGLLAVPAAVLVGLASAAPVFAYSATIRSDSMFSLLLRFVVVPMTLFAGVFFPVSALPWGVRFLAYVSPLWHGVELVRAATLGTPTAWGLPAHVGYLLVWGVGGLGLAVYRFHRRLAD
jgi:lipooligosaccharide transport system permease protein